MAILVFLTISLAVWHFTVFLPDRFRWGILGALFASLLGGLLSGVLLQIIFYQSFTETGFSTLLFPLPGVLLLLVLSYLFPSIKDSEAE